MLFNTWNYRFVETISFFDEIKLFFQMAGDLYGMLSGAISFKTGEKVVPAYGGECESFLNNIVTPIYDVIYEVLYIHSQVPY